MAANEARRTPPSGRPHREVCIRDEEALVRLGIPFREMRLSPNERFQPSFELHFCARRPFYLAENVATQRCTVRKPRAMLCGRFGSSLQSLEGRKR